MESIGTVDEMLIQELWTDYSISYNGVSICITEWNYGGLLGINSLYGVAQNNTNSKIMADIQFKFYDANDIQVGTASYVISDFEDSDKAKVVLGSKKIPYDATKYEITNITVYN